MEKDPTKITDASKLLVNGEPQTKLMEKVKLSDKGRRLDEVVREAQKKK